MEVELRFKIDVFDADLLVAYVTARRAIVKSQEAEYAIEGINNIASAVADAIFWYSLNPIDKIGIDVLDYSVLCLDNEAQNNDLHDHDRYILKNIDAILKGIELS